MCARGGVWEGCREGMCVLGVGVSCAVTLWTRESGM